MFTPYLLWIKLGAVLGACVFSAYAGYKWEVGRNAEAVLAAQVEYQTKYREAVDHGRLLAGQVEIKSREIQVLSTKKLVRLRSVTHDTPCLNPTLVRVLRDPTSTGLPEATGVIDDKSTDNLAATDTDVAIWIIDAQGRYSQCANQLNGLIDWAAKTDLLAGG